MNKVSASFLVAGALMEHFLFRINLNKDIITDHFLQGNLTLKSPAKLTAWKGQVGATFFGPDSICFQNTNWIAYYNIIYL